LQAVVWSAHTNTHTQILFRAARTHTHIQTITHTHTHTHFLARAAQTNTHTYICPAIFELSLVLGAAGAAGEVEQGDLVERCTNKSSLWGQVSR